MVDDTEIKSYAGFTIGPIYDLMSSAKKTKELWFSSYFFSWFVEKIVRELSSDSDITFVLPHFEKSGLPQISKTGRFPDRFIIYSKKGRDALFETLSQVISNSVNYFVNIIDQLVANTSSKYINGSSKDDVFEILNWYIQRNFVVFDGSVFEGKIALDVIAEINKVLNAMEYMRTFETGEDERTCFVCKKLPAVINAPIWQKPPFEEGKTRESKKEHEDLCPMCFLRYYAVESNEVLKKIGETENRNFSFPSVLEISAKEVLTDDLRGEIRRLGYNDFDADFDFKVIEKAFNELHKEDEDRKKEFKKKEYLKYFAILQADGDNLSKVLADSPTYENVKNLSSNLFKFGSEAEEIIRRDYGGYPIYIGGDDILAITPVATRNSKGFKNVIELAIDLAKKYEFVVQKSCSPETKCDTNLSVGINICYYKNPLSFALESARNQLFGVAKQVEGKNALALAFTKHSGHQLKFSFKFGTKEIDEFSKLLEGVLYEDFVFPHGMHHNLSEYDFVLANLGKEEQFNAFFENTFNEPMHRDKYKKGIEAVRDYFKEVLLCESIGSNGEKIKIVHDILTKLALINFLRGEE